MYWERRCRTSDLDNILSFVSLIIKNKDLKHIELCSMLCGRLDGRRVWARMDTCLSVAESLRSSPEIFTILFVNLLYPNALPTKVYIVKTMDFPVIMYRYESWTIRKAEHQKLMLLNCGAGEESQGSFGQHGDQTSQSERKTTLNIHWKDWCWSCPVDVKSWLIGKDPDAGKDWGQEEKEATEEKMVEWHHRLNGHEFEQTRGDGEAQGTRCATAHIVTESDTT